MHDAPYERAVRLAREAIADALREGRTLEELEGGLLERLATPPPGPRDRPRTRPRLRLRGDRPAARPQVARERAHAAL
jgi:hypothetical protein